MRKFRLLFGIACALSSAALVACDWNPSRPFDRHAPPVDEAIVLLDAGDAAASAATLEEYLSTGACQDGNVNVSRMLKKRPNGAFDLGLSFFGIAESYGVRFGNEEIDGGLGEPQRGLRGGQIECGLRVLRAFNQDSTLAGELRARAHYVEGNLLFLDQKYEEAVKAYDSALSLVPGLLDGGEEVGRDAAWNRAIALRRIDERKDAGQPDASSDSSSDASSDSSSDASNPDSGSDGGGDGGGNNNPDSGNQDSGKPPDPPPQEDSGPPPPPKANQDDRILDELENAPTVQQEMAKQAAAKRKGRRGTMVDK